MLINVTPVNDPAYGRVFITGIAQVGYELTGFTSSMGDRDGIPRDQLSYQWKRYAANGTTFETNIGANSSTYRVTDSDVGKTITLEVRFTDNQGTNEGTTNQAGVSVHRHPDDRRGHLHQHASAWLAIALVHSPLRNRDRSSPLRRPPERLYRHQSRDHLRRRGR